MRLRLIFSILFFTATVPVFSQVAPATETSKLPISIGAGFSEFYTDWSKYENGPTAWLDWNFYNAPSVLSGIGVEVQGRDLNYNRTGDIPTLREDTFGGGVIYTFRQIPYRHFHFYGKYLIEYGHINYSFADLVPEHHSNIVNAPGVGFEVRTAKDLWIRGDYEWQFWPNFPNVAPFHNALSPNGFTIGVSYRLPRAHVRAR